MTAYLNALGILCALGKGKSDVAANLFAGQSAGMQTRAGWIADKPVMVGEVQAALPTLDDALAAQRTRNNRLLLAAAREIESDILAAVSRHGADRIGIVLGTSTSGIAEAGESIATYVTSGTHAAEYDYGQQELNAPAHFLARHLGLTGPSYVISTACTSSARALLTARRLLNAGLCDAVLCGGVDSLCRLTLNGFHALEAVSATRCNPFSAQRQGINIGEGAALFLMSREPAGDASIALLGAAANSDAYHISAPDPQGRGAEAVMRAALRDAGMTAGHIDYLNLHGTATQHNDAMESLAVSAVFPDGVPSSSTKPLTGHTLGAAGALEAAFCWLTLSAFNPDRLLPPHRWDGQPDPSLPRLRLVQPGTQATPGVAMSNSFAFGGSNVSLILGVTP